MVGLSLTRWSGYTARDQGLDVVSSKPTSAELEIGPENRRLPEGPGVGASGPPAPSTSCRCLFTSPRLCFLPVNGVTLRVGTGNSETALPDA